MSLIHFVRCDFRGCTKRVKVEVRCKKTHHIIYLKNEGWKEKEGKHFCKQAHLDNLPEPKKKKRKTQGKRKGKSKNTAL